VSQHTVKTQAMSIYRKLGVSSRGQAVQRVEEVGLLVR
jgi:ATP/maltotriose-dependent transcriptional regulator MalT